MISADAELHNVNDHLPPITSPLAQSVRIGFKVIYLIAGLFALSWMGSNIRQISSDNRAVILRFGKVERVQASGLILAWPRPFEEVRLLPARGRQLVLEVKAEASGIPSDETDVQFTPNDDIIHLRVDKDVDNAAYLLTGDGSAIRLDATLFFNITDPATYILSETRVKSALRRTYRTSAVALVASHPLRDFIVVSDADQESAASRKSSEMRVALRGAFVAQVNARFDDLKRHGVAMGVELSRIDLTFVLPPVAKAAFDEVLTASQTADQNMAAARTDASRILQEATREQDRLVTEARAAAEERTRLASADTATIQAVAFQLTPLNRASLLDQTYREQIGKIVEKAGRTIVVDGLSGQHLILPGASR